MGMSSRMSEADLQTLVPDGYEQDLASGRQKIAILRDGIGQRESMRASPANGGLESRIATGNSTELSELADGRTEMERRQKLARFREPGWQPEPSLNYDSPELAANSRRQPGEAQALRNRPAAGAEVDYARSSLSGFSMSTNGQPREQLLADASQERRANGENNVASWQAVRKTGLS